MRITLLYFLLAFCTLLQAQPFYNSGRLPLYNIKPDEYVEQHPQNHIVIQGDNGLVYVGNNGGLLFYDGNIWRRAVGSENKILTLVKNDNGDIYYGGENDLGQVKVDSIGQLYLESFLEHIPDSLRDFGRMDKIICLKNTVNFICTEILFVFNNQQLESFNQDIEYSGALKYQNRLILNDRKNGLFSVRGDGKDLIACDFDLEGLNLFKSQGNSVLAFGKTSAMKFSLDGQSAKVLLEFDYPSEIIEARVTDFEIFDEYIILGTKNNGLLILDKDFNIVKRVNSKNSELQNDFVKKMHIDDEKNLWLALDKGISVIDLSSSFTRYNSDENIRGIINDLVITEEDIIIGGSQGLLFLNKQEESKFKEAAEVLGEIWAVEELKFVEGSFLSMASDNTIEMIKNGKQDTVVFAFPWDIHQSINERNRVWIGNDNGFLTLKWNGKRLELEYKNFSINSQIRKVTTDGKGNVWLGSRNGKIYQIKEYDLDSQAIKSPLTFDTTNGLPGSDYILPYLIHEKVFFATTEGVYEFNEENKFFEKSTSFDSKYDFQNRIILRMFPASKNEVWLTNKVHDANSFENGIYNFKTNQWVYKQFTDISKGVQFAGYYDSLLRELWIGGSEGLYRIKRTGFEDHRSYKTIISNVKYDPDSVMFGGHMFEGFSNNTYNYSRKPLRFSFGANSYKRKDDLKFKYYLEGFDETWTDWNEEAEAVYTNLPGGKYNMRVKAIDFFENESEEASFAFTILPPWYFTPWAYTLYLIGFVGFVYGAIRVSTVSLQRVIKDNTKEIVAQKDEIEAKNSVLEKQKGRIEKQNLNILDSIRYAKRIQMATLPAEDKIQKSVDNAWVMYRPKDIVSGDFYWLENFKDAKEEKVMLAAVDCTGHGVPGAFMSIIGYNGLNRVVREYKLNRPSDILDRLNEIITTSLNQQGAQREEIKDGMDMSLCSFDRKNLKLEFAGAHNSLYIIRKGDEKLEVNGNPTSAAMTDKNHKLYEIKADKQPIGAFENRKNFNNHEIQLMKDDMIILFTDGYADQFGGPKGKKFFYKPFKNLLLSIADKTVDKQHEIIEQTFNDWISHPDKNGDAHEQVDDICVLGIKV